jgi:hypothetical protein
MKMAVSTDKFTWDSKNKKFIGEISEIGGVFERIFSDTHDIGLRVISAKTGKEVRFCVHRTIVTNAEDGEIVKWVLRVAREDVRKFPQLKDVEMIIFND